MTFWTEVLESAEVTKKKRGGILRAFLNVCKGDYYANLY